MPKLVQDFIMDNISMIGEGPIEIMIRDIKTYGGTERNVSAYGADYDYKEWMAFQNFLEAILAERKK